MFQGFKHYILFLLIVYTYSQIVSRNSKIQSMLDLLKQNQLIYDTVIKKYEDKIGKEYQTCINRTKSDNCSNFYIWQQERSKNSKNVTILKEKIQKHNETIDAIMQLNKLEVTKKNLTMVKMFPKVKKLKDDIELIDSMIYLIEDTYLSLDLPNKSLLSLFSIPIISNKTNLILTKKLKHSFVQIMNKQEEEVKKTEKEDNADEKNANQETEGKESTNNKDEEQSKADKVPLIDEEIFSGEADQSQDNLFETEPIPDEVPDEIPQGVEVPEHDQNAKTAEEVGVPDPRISGDSQDLRIFEVRDQFKTRVREVGRNMHGDLTALAKELQIELDGKVQSILDLEYAILSLHSKHAKQIIQIYKQTKLLQAEIFKIDDLILKLDARMHDCMNADKAEGKCEEKKGLDQIVIEDLKTEKAFNIGAQRELEKLLQLQDRMVKDPRANEPPIQSSLSLQQKQIQQDALNAKRSELEKRIQRIKDEEAEVEKEIEKQQQDQQATTLKEAEEQKYKEEESLVGQKDVLIKDNQELEKHSLTAIQDQIEDREVDEVLKQVDNELNSQQSMILLNRTNSHDQSAFIQSDQQINREQFTEQNECQKQFVKKSSGQFQLLRKSKNKNI